MTITTPTEQQPTVTPVTAKVGAEVGGVDLGADLHPTAVAGPRPVGVDGRPSVAIKGDSAAYAELGGA
jgi:hypothetical protein